MKTSVIRYDTIVLGLLKKEKEEKERRRRMPNYNFFTLLIHKLPYYSDVIYRIAGILRGV